MKKIIILFVLLLITLTLLTGCKGKKINITSLKDEDGYLIGTSNKKNADELQIKIIIDKVNIRKKATVNSDKIGVVKKGAIFTVLEYKKDNKFIWYRVETKNKIKGYIASDIENPYVETTKEIDYINPTINIKTEQITVENRNEIEQKIMENIEYKDNMDENPKCEYEVDYNRTNTFVYEINIKVTDESSNITTSKMSVKITGEKQVSTGKWITYNDMINHQKKAKSLCYKYGLIPWEDAIGCISNDGIHNIMVANYTGTTRIGFYRPFTYCNYDKDLNISYCEDGNGNSITHELISDNLKTLENQWLPKFKNYKKEVLETTGYDLYDLTW